MKLTSSLTDWLYWFRRMIIITGYIALIAIAAGADVRVKSTDLLFTDDLLMPKGSTPTPLIFQQCSVKKQSDMCSTKGEPHKKI